MESGNLKNIVMEYLTLRWFTLTHFDKNKFKLFHSLEKALNITNTKNLCWHIQTESYLRQEFKRMTKMNNINLTKLKNFEHNLQNFLIRNRIDQKLLLKNLDFIQKCDKIIYHRTHAHNNTSYTITSLP